MSQSKNFIKKNSRVIVFIFIIIISNVLMSYTGKNNIFDIRKFFFTIISPFPIMTYSVGGFFQNTINSIGELKRVKSELSKANEDIEDYKKVIVDFNVLNKENEDLRKLLDLKQRVVYNSVSAEIIGRNAEKCFDMLIINKGSNDGIKERMPVISYSGGKKVLVGKIVEVTPFLSKVLSVNNPLFNVGVVIARNNVHCIVTGENKKFGIVKLLYLPKQYNVSQEGLDYVYTSGDSQIFPQGLEIGKIIQILPSARYEIFNEAYIELSVDLATLDHVLILQVNPEKDNFKLMENLN